MYTSLGIPKNQKKLQRIQSESKSNTKLPIFHFHREFLLLGLPYTFLPTKTRGLDVPCACAFFHNTHSIPTKCKDNGIPKTLLYKVSKDLFQCHEGTIFKPRGCSRKILTTANHRNVASI